MQRKLGMKRSFNYEDLSSIVNKINTTDDVDGRSSCPVASPGDDDDDDNYNECNAYDVNDNDDNDTIYADNRDSKRIRVVSYDSSLGSASCSFCNGKHGHHTHTHPVSTTNSGSVSNAALSFKTLACSSSDDSLQGGRGTSSPASPFSFPKPVVTPEFVPVMHPSSRSSSHGASDDDDDSGFFLPNFPLLSSNNNHPHDTQEVVNKSELFPATAALNEKIASKESDPWEGGLYPLCDDDDDEENEEEECKDCHNANSTSSSSSSCCVSWPMTRDNLNHNINNMDDNMNNMMFLASSPNQVHHFFPSPTTSTTTTKRIEFSIGSNNGEIDRSTSTISTPFSLFSMPSSSYHRNRAQRQNNDITTVNQITKALARM